MRHFYNTTLCVVLLCSVLLLSGESVATAREPVVAARPNTELDVLLTNWERASANMRTLEAMHYHWVYDTVFEAEKRGQGSLYLEGKDKGRLEVAPSTIHRSETSHRIGRQGSPYLLEPADPTEWIWTGDKWYSIDHKEKTAECVHFPESPVESSKTTTQAGFFNWNFFAAWSYLATSPGNAMPLVHDIRAADIKSRFELKIVKHTDNKAMIVATPKKSRDQDNFREISVILDLKTYLVTAWKAVDPSGNIETTYRFFDWRVNQPPRGGKNPLAVNLKGYKICEYRDAKSSEQPTRDDQPILVPVNPG